MINLKNLKPDIRRLKEMKKVIYDKKWLKTAPNLELYYMYRGIKKSGDLRYDITIIPSLMMGKEFVKTAGHFHSEKFQELYIVLQGEAIFLMQKGKWENLKDIYAVKAKKGNAVIVPPKYGHVTINPSNKELKLANWISDRVKYDYSQFKKLGGAGYFYTKNGWVKNKNYKKLPKLRFEKPLKEIPKNLDFLR